MMRPLQLATVILSAVVSVGCATMTVSSHVERGLDFSRYRTFDWGAADALPIGDRRLDANPFFKDYLLGAVEKRLAHRGLELTGRESPDLLIHYHASISQRLAVDDRDNADAYCSRFDCASPALINDEVGTIVLDIIDARTERLIWRGWAQSRVADILGDREHMAKTIDASIERMLLRLPPAM